MLQSRWASSQGEYLLILREQSSLRCKRKQLRTQKLRNISSEWSKWGKPTLWISILGLTIRVEVLSGRNLVRNSWGCAPWIKIDRYWVNYFSNQWILFDALVFNQISLCNAHLQHPFFVFDFFFVFAKLKELFLALSASYSPLASISYCSLISLISISLTRVEKAVDTFMSSLAETLYAAMNEF